MAIRNVLDSVLNHEIKTKLLRILCKRDMGWTGRRLASELKISPTTANKFLKELAGDGIITAVGAGRSYLYSINPENHVVTAILKPFFKKEKTVFNSALSLIKRSLLSSGAKIKSIAIFGSIARREEAPRSDIDLVIILESLKDKNKIDHSLDDIAKKIAQRFQTVISPYLITDVRFKKRYKSKDALIREILRSYILIYGKPLERIIV